VAEIRGADGGHGGEKDCDQRPWERVFWRQGWQTGREERDHLFLRSKG